MPPPEVAAPLSAGELSAELEELYRSWRILDLVGLTARELPPAWLRILEIARNILLHRPIPGMDFPDELAELVTPPEPVFTTQRLIEHKKRVVYPVTGDLAVQPLHQLEDFAQATLPDMMLRNISQELFDFRLISGGINGLYNLESGPAEVEYDDIVEVRVPTGGFTKKRRQKVYALLDVSNSMRDANKEIFAKGLLLAYLVIASEEGAEIYLRTFGNTVHARSDCVTKADFPALAQRVLRVTPDGSTDIKLAIDAAVGDIRALDNYNTLDRLGAAPPTEILLISDCESYEVPYLPRGIQLHTVHLKSGRMMTAYKKGFERIRAESRTFTEIETAELHLPDSARDRWLLEQDGKSLERNLALRVMDGISPEEERRRDLLSGYQRMRDRRGERRRGVARAASAPFRPALGFGDMIMALLEAIRRVFTRPASQRWEDAEEAQSRPPLGLRFRERR